VVSLNLKQRWARIALGTYLILIQVLIPLLAPLRVLGEIEPGEVKNFFLPPLFLLILATFGLGNLLKIRTVMHLALGFAFISAALIGFPRLLEVGGQRAYFSHLFQIASAFVMLGVGWTAMDWCGYQFFRRFVLLSLIATLISTAITLWAFGRGDVSRLYTPAYTFLFVAAFSASFSKKMSALTIVGLLVSNKRGPIASVVLMYAQHLFSSLRGGGGHRRLRKSVGAGKLIAVAIAGGIFLISMIVWASGTENQDSAVARAINITYTRLVDIVAPSDSDRSLDELSSGRFEEIEETLKELSPIDFVVGSGAGWSVQLSEGLPVQNIHFSPLSLTAVFGAPFAVFVYCYFGLLIFRAIRRKDDLAGFSVAERMAPLYLSGALLHSFFAYSLFIDWLVFFFAGVLSRSLSLRQRHIRRSAEVRS
jgi:TM2 domain-containing membrane protein YozV